MAPTSIADALASCLSRIEAGEPLPVVLADHPDQADELKALIRAAMVVRTHRPAPSTAFRASLQHHLSALPPLDRTPLVLRPRLSARVWALRTAAAVAAGVVAFSGLAVASADSRPGDVLYPIRRGVERIHDAADRVAPPIGRAIDYLTIRTVPDEPASATPEPTAALAPGSTVIEPLDRPTRVRNTPPADDAPTGQSVATGRRSLPNPGVVVVGDAGTQAAQPPADDAAATLRAGQAGTAAAGETAQPTATARRSQTPAAAGTDTPPPAAPPVVAATAAPPGAPGGISGIVIGQEGSGLPGAMVSVYPLREDGEPRWGARVSLRTQLDGTFVLNELAPGRYKLAVGELAPWVWRVWYKDTLNVKQAEPITVEPARETDGIEVRLRRNPWSFSGWGGHGRRGRR